jgi:hypothetical protein
MKRFLVAVYYPFTRMSVPTDSLAQAGFIVISVGQRGGYPSRSKWYHNYGYGNMRSESEKIVDIPKK